MPAIRAVIFDMDGTLLDSERYWRLLAKDLLEAHGLEIPEDAREAYATMTFRDQIRDYLNRPDCKLTMDYDACIAWCFDRLRWLYEHEMPAKPGARACLDTLIELSVPACVLTATPEPSTLAALTRTGLLDGLAFVSSLSEHQHTKATSEVFVETASRLQVPVESCLVVEDALYAMKGARSAGCTVWAMEDPTWAKDKPQILQTAHLYFHSLYDMAEALTETFHP